MPDTPEFLDGNLKPVGSSRIPEYSIDWDRLLNVYTIQELPGIPADSEAGSENIPFGLKVLREFFLDAANSYASEIWFDFAPGRNDMVDACYTPIGKGTNAIRIPRSLFFENDPELGIFAFLFEKLSDDGMFAIQVCEFKDRPAGRTGPFDRRGRIIQPATPPNASDVQTGKLNFPAESSAPGETELPGITEIVTIRAFRICLKGRSVPEDVVIQICPRFWHMPTGFSVG